MTMNEKLAEYHPCRVVGNKYTFSYVEEGKDGMRYVKRFTSSKSYPFIDFEGKDYTTVFQRPTKECQKIGITFIRRTNPYFNVDNDDIRRAIVAILIKIIIEGMRMVSPIILKQEENGQEKITTACCFADKDMDCAR